MLVPGALGGEAAATSRPGHAAVPVRPAGDVSTRGRWASRRPSCTAARAADPLRSSAAEATPATTAAPLRRPAAEATPPSTADLRRRPAADATPATTADVLRRPRREAAPAITPALRRRPAAEATAAHSRRRAASKAAGRADGRP